METPTSRDLLKVSDLKNRGVPLHFQGHYTFDDIATEGPMICDWKIGPETAGFSIHGDIKGVMSLECARCLAPYPVPVALEIDEQYVYDSYVDPYEREKELSPEDFFEVVSEAGELDLKDLVHQFLILESANHSACGQVECGFAQAEGF